MIHLIPLDHRSGEIIEDLGSSLEALFEVPILQHEPTTLPASGYDPEREQYSSSQMLVNLTAFKNTLTNLERVLGIVSVDLYTDDLDFVFGEEDTHERVGVISIIRLQQEFYNLPPDKTLFQQRILKEAAHGLGHIYNLGHCSNSACVMYFSSQIGEIDQKGNIFCKECHPGRNTV